MSRRILFLIVALLATQAYAYQDPYNGKVTPPLRLLMAMHRVGIQKAPPDLRDLISAPEVSVVVQLTSPRDPAVWEGRGLRLRRTAGGGYAGMAGIYGAIMRWDEIARWVEDPGILQISSSRWPAVVPCLDLSAPEVGADDCWEMLSSQGLPITGQGQLVADFDTGVDVFHPALFRPSTTRYEWLDMNSNGLFNSGVDAVDLNGNGVGDFGELLRFFDGQIYDSAQTFVGNPSNNDGVYQANWDWLYNDADDNAMRSYGSAFFSEADPGYGEKLFYCDDANHNNSLDPGEDLILLGQSKVRAVYDVEWHPPLPPVSVIRRRGIDLIQTQPDYNGHGTGVSGILVGGEPGRSKFCGLAPGADLLMGNSALDFVEYLPWVYYEGCRILLYEFGRWTYNPLDGSFPDEILMDSLAGEGLMHVAPSGNLNRGHKHCQLQIASSESVAIDVAAAPNLGIDATGIWGDFLWRDPSVQLSVSLLDPYGNSISLLGTGTTQSFGSWDVWSFFWVSSRGTAGFYFDLYGYSGIPIPVTGDWTITLHHPGGGTGFEVNGYIQDDASAWGGGVEFAEYHSNTKTVTWPATADSAFVLGSYSTRGYEQYIGQGFGSIQIGQISLFSGRGPRIDGMPRLSVISPGNYDVYSTRSVYGQPYTHGGWRQFSGTSAAGPHVAAAAILARQADSTLTRVEIQNLLETYAYQDNFTGSTWNDSAGYGKVRIDGIVSYLGMPLAPGPKAIPATLGLSASPNPFNAELALHVDLPSRQTVELTVWDLQGRKVADLYRGEMMAGTHRVTWNAVDLTSGIYWVAIKSGERQVVQKVALVK